MKWWLLTFNARGDWTGTAGFYTHKWAEEYARRYKAACPGSRVEVWPNGWQEAGE